MQVVAFNTFILAFMLSQTAFADSNYRVKSSDNLISIAEKQYEGSGLTQSQILVGIYASNPKSFKNGNINKLLRGQKLVLPDANKIDQISHGEAELVLSARKQKKKERKKKRFKKRIKSTKSKRKIKSGKKKKTKSISQKRNVQKIEKLEKEGASLKIRLEKLMAEKNASDSKLKELEGSLQEALKKTAAITMVSTVSEGTKSEEGANKTVLEKIKETSESQKLTQRANEKLREKNNLLEKRLQESRKEAAGNARASLEKESVKRAIKEPQKSIPDNAVEVDNNKPDETDEVTKTDKTNKIQSSSADGTSTFDSSNKYLQWALLSLLLLPLVWFAKRLITSKKVKEQPAWVTETEEPNDMLSATNERINTHYQEAPLESSIKLDVANAYLDAGNTDEAIEILNEIVAEGNEEQQAQAQALLNNI